MASKNTHYTIHPALGGLDISSDPTVLDPNFLTIADNIEYREGAQRKKRQGTALYSTGLPQLYLASSSSAVRAISDFFRYGTSLTATRRIVAVAGASIYQSPGDGTFVPLTATSSFGSNDSVTTNMVTAGDYEVISDGASNPLAWDQTTLFSTLSTKAFTSGKYHLDRLFYTGYSSAPSEFTYTAAGNIFDSTGGDTGVVSVRKGDGDQIIGISEPFYGSLYVFKGPNFGSVHQFSGNTPATFATAQVAHGAPALNNRAIISTPTDIYWLSAYGIHSLQTTVKFGNVEQAFLSLPIQKLWRNEVITVNQLTKAWGFWNPRRNIVGWAVVPNGSDSQSWLLVYNYALSDPKPGGKKFWSIWKFSGFGVRSGALIALTVPGESVMFFGGESDGLIHGQGRELVDNIFTDNGQSYSAIVKTPTITRFKGDRGDIAETSEKIFEGIVTYFSPNAGSDADLSVIVDRRQQTSVVPMAGGGTPLGSFILGTDTLSGGDFNYWENPEIQDRGRSISIQWSHSADDSMELFGYSVRFKEGETIAREQS